MGCTSSLHKIQRDIDQTRLKLDETVENLKSANETIQQLETKFINANAELEATRTKLNEMQSYSMFNLPSMPPIPSMPTMFSSNQQNQEEQSQLQKDGKYQVGDQQTEEEKVQNKEIDSYIFPTMLLFTSPSSKPSDNNNIDQTTSSSSSLSTPSFINDLFKSFETSDYSLEEGTSNERSAEKSNSILQQKNQV